MSLLLGSLFAFFNQSPIIGYLLGGLFLKIFGNNLITTNQHGGYLTAISELGISLLLFSIGLEFSWSKLKSFGKRSLLIGASQIIITALLACIIIYCFSTSLKESIILGFMLSLSSTACVLRIIMDRAEIDSEYGKNSLIILLSQDIAIIPISIIIILISGEFADGSLTLEVFKIFAALVCIIFLLYLTVNKAALKILPKLSLNQNKELTVLLAIVLGIGSAWIAHAFKISPALGAFVTGMFLASSKFSHQITANVSGFKIVLVTLFFSSAGMLADPIWIKNNLALVIIATLFLIVFKMTIIAIILRFFKQNWGIGFSTGLALSQIGEFAFVLGDIAFKYKSLSQENYQLVISVVITSMFLTPFLIKSIPNVRNYINKYDKKVISISGADNNQNLNVNYKICIIGFGPAGQQVANEFKDIPDQVCVVDLNISMLEIAKNMGFKTILGDCRQLEIIEHAHISSTEILAITIPDFDSASIVLKNAKQVNNSIFVVIRSRYDKNVDNFYTLGADEVIAEESEAGKQMIRAMNSF